MLHYEEVRPSVSLQSHIECYWSLKTDFSLKEEPCLPDGSASIIFNFGPPYWRTIIAEEQVWEKHQDPVLVHQGKKSVYITQASPVDVLGVRFKPYGLQPFLQLGQQVVMPPYLIPLKEIPPFDASLILRLEKATHFMDRIPILDHLFSALLPSAQQVDGLVESAVSIMLKSGGNIKISDLYDQLYVSKSTLEKKFQEYIGLSPKILCNIFRFNRIVFAQSQKPTPSLTELAYNQGFFDQSHLVHSFRSFTGLPPGQFFKQQNRLVEMLQQSYENRIASI